MPPLTAIDSLTSLESSSHGDSASQQDQFDQSMQPIVYLSENRIPVIADIQNAIIYVIFTALIVSLIFVLPAMRRTKLATFLGLATILIMGASILLALQGSSWLTGSAHIHRLHYKAMSRETIGGEMNIGIGLQWVNVSLYGNLKSPDRAELKLLDMNERFQWDQPGRMALDHIEALRRGLPYPILTVTDFLSQDSEGFNWVRQLRFAGYYCTMALNVALASWCLTVVVMCALPIYLAYMIQLTAGLMSLAVFLYSVLVSSPALYIGGELIKFEFGFSYHLTLSVGAISMLIGVLLLAFQSANPHKQLTIMDSDTYVKDQEALYGSKKPPNSPNSSAVIPIEDIQKAFNVDRAS